ncbi:MAG: c-type cytochrome [Burkholderiales bacterium]|nr:c-type cytochrome [Burkholderiales bacterium]
MNALCRTLFLVPLTAAVALAAPLARADAALLKKHNCISCHQVDKKILGPSYREVAKKYKGQKDIAAKLAAKVKKGGQGVWGQVPMPPNAAVPDADIQKMVAYILAL